MLQINQQVKTPDGIGTILFITEHGIGVMLLDTIEVYWPSELNKYKQNLQQRK